MNKEQYKCLLVSNFTIDNFSGYLNNDQDLPKVESTAVSLQQVIPVLANKDLECWKNNPYFTVVWTQPESVIESFNRIINYQTLPLEKILEEVDEYSSLLLNLSQRQKLLFVPIWAHPSYHAGFGMLEMKTGVGIANTLMRMNLRLCENLEKAANIHVLNTQRWINLAGKDAFSPKLWYMGKIAFGNAVFMEAVKDIKSALRGITGNAKKLIILDLDDTLWGGIVGEIGSKNIRLGGHDHMGEAYCDFQHALKALTHRGILLGIVSKNEEDIALEAVNHHPEMVLRLKDFVGWRINWQDKVQNIIDLVSELNLGLESVVFIDDSPVERARVREALPEVFVPEWPEDCMLYKSTLLSLHCFNNPTISKEDRERSGMYVSEQKRQALKRDNISLDEWLKSLDIKVKVEELNQINLPRIVQLLNKTNQMNLTTRRMTEAELMDWIRKGKRKLWSFRVSDKFGDSGLTGMISLQLEDKRAKIIDFILSCRVIGRKVEETMLSVAVNYTQSLRAVDEVYAKYIPTAKNKPCLEFWGKSGFMHNQEDNSFCWKVNQDYPTPPCIQIED